MANLDEQILMEDAILDPQKRWIRSRIGDSPLIPGNDSKPKSTILREDLRSGFNTVGVFPTADTTLRILEKLEEAGVQEVEIGYPHTKEHCEYLRTAKKAGIKIKLGGHINIRAKDYRHNIDIAADEGFDMVNFIGAMNRIRGNSERKSGQNSYEEELKVVERGCDAIEYAKSKGLLTCAGGGTDRLDYFATAYSAFAKAGADRLYVYDARGWYTPDTVQFLVRYAREIAGPDIGIFVHCHNDFGMAVANTIMGIKAGASGADVTINGTGHRTGNAPFEQVAVALKVLCDIETGIDMSKIYGICKLVEKEYNIPIPKNAPITGDYVYTYLGRKIPFCLRGDWLVFENIVAEELGQKRDIIWAGSTPPGRQGSIPVKVEAMGLTCTDEEIDRIYEKMMEICHKKNYASDTEMEEIIHQVLGR